MKNKYCESSDKKIRLKCAPRSIFRADSGGFGCEKWRRSAISGGSRQWRAPNPAREQQRRNIVVTWRQDEWTDVFHVEISSPDFFSTEGHRARYLQNVLKKVK